MDKVKNLASWRIPTLYFFVYLLYGCLFLSVLTDWIGYAVDEGYTTYAAQRWMSGQLPHRDFFFLWTPGIAAVHALIQSLGGGWFFQRLANLVIAAASGAILLHQAQNYGWGHRRLWLFSALNLLWGFTLWNHPYSSWWAVAFGLLGLLLQIKHAYLSGVSWGISFWFKQNIGILGLLGSLWGSYLGGQWSGWRKVLFAALLVIVAPFLGLFLLGTDAFLQAFRQIFLFPLQYRKLMAEPLLWVHLASPLVFLGMWVLSLYIAGAKDIVKKAVRLVQLIVLFYLAWSVYRSGERFFLGAFFVLSLFAWLCSFAFLAQKGRRRELAFWFACLGMFLQVYPRFDFQHFLFVFPLSSFFLLYGLFAIKERYVHIPKAWLYLPLFILLVGGAFFQAKVWAIRVYGKQDSFGRISMGSAHLLNQEMAQVIQYLRDRGLQEGDPILVLPNATSFYTESGFRNPTAHNQFFPGYVEAFGDRQEDVLKRYEDAGGHFLVIQQRSHLSTNVPQIYQEIISRYQESRQFPVHFSVWEKKP